MNTVKSILGLFLGLVLQLSQVPPCLAAQPEKSCEHGMSCCREIDSCPCAKESRENEKPSPLLPVGMDLKALLSKAPEALLPETRLSPAAESMAAMVSPALCRTGYAGVPLSVAFCRFVI